MRKALLINGPPASGKTTIAEKIVPILNYPFFSLDTIKEVLFKYFGTGNREYNRFLGSVSFEIIQRIIANYPPNACVIIEAWFGSSIFNSVEKQLRSVGIDKFAEIWCYAPGSVLADRYVKRVDSRHKGHPGESYAQELIGVARNAEPLGIGPVLEIDTSVEQKMFVPKDVSGWVRKALE